MPVSPPHPLPLPPLPPAPPAPPAGPLRRLVAHGLDLGLYLALAGPALTALYGAGYWLGGYPWWLAGWWDFVLVVLGPPLALALCWWRRGATPGQWLAGVRVVDAWDGGPVAPAQAARRALALVALGGLTGGLALLPGLWDGRPRFDDPQAPGRGPHDRWADTRAVRVPSALARQAP